MALQATESLSVSIFMVNMAGHTYRCTIFFLFNTEICDSIMKCFIHLPNKQKISGSIPGRERNQTSGGSHCGGRLVNKGEAESSFLFIR